MSLGEQFLAFLGFIVPLLGGMVKVDWNPDVLNSVIISFQKQQNMISLL